MPVSRLLVANRGEIAVRILHTAAALGLPTVAVYAADESSAEHPAMADRAVALAGTGPAAYLDVAALVAAARDTDCDAVHPGYGFLSERADFAAACAAAGLTFVGPSPDTLALFGDKVRARRLAVELGVDVLAGTEVLTGADPAAELATAREFLAGLGPGAAAMVKAVAGGGGRGIRPLRWAPDRTEERNTRQLADMLERCRSEALHSFGDARLYLERLLPGARHVEVQLLGDDAGAVIALGERDCSVQRRWQKLLEIAPAPGLSAATGDRLRDAAVRLGRAADRLGLATAEFLVAPGPTVGPDTATDEVVFLEVNARLQVEHTVTEEVTGLDLVELQLRVAGGAGLAELGLDPAHPPAARGVAVQARVNAETLGTDGSVRPAAGTLTRFAPPTGRGVRVDTHAAAGHAVSPRYDSLLAKVIVVDPAAGADPAGLARVTALAGRALAGFEVAGTATNLGLLRALLAHPGLGNGALHTGFVDEHLAELLDTAAELDAHAGRDDAPATPATGKQATGEQQRAHPAGTITAPLAGVVVELPVTAGQHRAGGAALAVLEAMKMEHEVAAPGPVTVARVLVEVGEAVAEGTPLLVTEPAEPTAEDEAGAGPEDLDRIRPDLAESLQRHRIGLDEGRPDATRKRHDAGRRTARENLAELCDPGTFTEYGALTIAAQRRRRELADLIARTPADGLVTGTANVGGLRCAVLSYDYTVLAGTQGVQNHRKTDRLLELAHRQRLPVVMFAEGGGGRPGDTDQPGFTGLDVSTFRLAAELVGEVPTVAVVSGYCFAGNAALAGVCDVLIATEGASLGMGGPAMIAGGGLGEVEPGAVGPMSVQVPNGVVDLLVANDGAAVAAARRYLSYCEPEPHADWECADQRLLRQVIPENRVRSYPIRPVLDTLFDSGSVLELRAAYGVGILTALARLEGHPVAVLANDPTHLGGAIDAEAADKATRFLGICDAYGLPVVSLCDTPGFMVGPEAERTATVRRFGAMFVAGAKLRSPLCTLVLRKGYGLGAMAMAGGHFKAPLLTAAWPTGEFGGMGLEGAVQLGYRAELTAVTDPAQRRARYDELVDRAYQHGKALSTAAAFEIDDVIDPAATRTVLSRVFGWKK
ncbi:MAG TPA: carboxyl transferase domain-containing protein [Pseudonocardia sp.]|nr:carboxyl transferase domain-containing protein [Pseudonocardia sp.]